MQALSIAADASSILSLMVALFIANRVTKITTTIRSKGDNNVNVGHDLTI